MEWEQTTTMNWIKNLVSNDNRQLKIGQPVQQWKATVTTKDEDTSLKKLVYNLKKKKKLNKKQ